MYYIYCLLLITTGAGLAMYGLKKFGLMLALSFAIPSIMLLGMLGWIGVTSLVIVGIISALIFFLTKPLTYFNAWFFGTILICLPFAILYDAISIESDGPILKTTVYIAMLASLVVTILFRRHLKAIIIGISSGYSLGLGLAGIVSANLFMSGNIFDALALPGVIILAAIIGGILFQYLYIAKNNPELINPAKSTL